MTTNACRTCHFWAADISHRKKAQDDPLGDYRRCCQKASKNYGEWVSPKTTCEQWVQVK